MRLDADVYLRRLRDLRAKRRALAPELDRGPVLPALPALPALKPGKAPPVLAPAVKFGKAFAAESANASD